MIPLVHLKQVNTKNYNSYLQYSFKTQNFEKPDLLPISSSTIRENNWYFLEYAIFHVEIIVSEYTLRYTESCV